MAGKTKMRAFEPGQPAPISGYYQCGADCRHRMYIEEAGGYLPQVPDGCPSDVWHLANG